MKRDVGHNEHSTLLIPVLLFYFVRADVSIFLREKVFCPLTWGLAEITSVVMGKKLNSQSFWVK